MQSNDWKVSIKLDICPFSYGRNRVYQQKEVLRVAKQPRDWAERGRKRFFGMQNVTEIWVFVEIRIHGNFGVIFMLFLSLNHSRTHDLNTNQITKLCNIQSFTNLSVELALWEIHLWMCFHKLFHFLLLLELIRTWQSCLFLFHIEHHLLNSRSGLSI